MGLRIRMRMRFRQRRQFHGNAGSVTAVSGHCRHGGRQRRIWTAIKTIPTRQHDVVADIEVTGIRREPAASPPGHTWSRPATRSVGAKEHLGSASAYMKIFDQKRIS